MQSNDRNIALLHSGRLELLLSHPDGGSYRPPTREKLRVNRTGAFCQAMQGCWARANGALVRVGCGLLPTSTIARRHP